MLPKISKIDVFSTRVNLTHNIRLFYDKLCVDGKTQIKDLSKQTYATRCCSNHDSVHITQGILYIKVKRYK